MDLPKLQQLANHLKKIQEARLQHDLKTSTQIKDGFEQLIEQNNRRLSEMKIDQAIRRGEETVEIWSRHSIPFGVTQNGARAIRDEKLAELTKLDEQELVNLQAEFDRLKTEAVSRNTKYLATVEKKREIEDGKSAAFVSNLSGGVHHATNMLGIIIVLENMVHALLFPPVSSQSLASTVIYDDDSGNEIGFVIGSDVPAVELHGMKAITVHGLQTPDSTPPSLNEPRFDTFAHPETPTPVTRKSTESVRRPLPVAGNFRTGSASSSATIINTVLPSTRAVVSVSDFTGPRFKKKVFIDLTSDTDDDLPPPKRRTIGRVPSTPARSNQLITPPASKVKTSKLKAKKPILQPFVHRQASTSEGDDTTGSSSSGFALAVVNTSPKTKTVLAPIPPREDSASDSDSSYNESPTQKRKRHHSPSAPRAHTGSLTMGKLLDRPGSKLSAKGTPFWKWSRLVYVPAKLLKFPVSFIWAHKENGEISTWNDRNSPLGFYLLRKAHSFIPVVGHARKEDEMPEFVVEECEIAHMQYNSEGSLVCLTKNVGPKPDILIKFADRGDLWSFLVVSYEQMGITIHENLSLRLPKEWLV